jgi:hypothetical protein
MGLLRTTEIEVIYDFFYAHPKIVRNTYLTFMLFPPLSNNTRVKVMECSAKDNYNVTELFKTLLSLSKIIPTENNSNSDTYGGPLKRRSSAYYSGKGEQDLFCD